MGHYLLGERGLLIRNQISRKLGVADVTGGTLM